jgi:hypothetical protein
MKQSPHSSSDRVPVRKPIMIALVVLLLLGVAALVPLFIHQDSQSSSVAEPDENTVAAEPADVERPVMPKAEPAQNRPRTASVPSPPPPKPRTYADQIVSALVQLNMTNGPLTPEKLAAWRSTIQQLTNQGPAAVAALREFFQSKQDVNFDSIGGAGVMGQPSMRLALLEAVTAMSGAEATPLAAEALRTAIDPREITTISRYLDQQAPGEYNQAALDAARAALAQARQSGMTGNVDVGALFDVLLRYGGPEAVQDFQDAKGRWTYYSAIALGQLPEGKGIPALVAMTQEGSAYTRSAALQMLAQWAPDSADARNVLLEQARSGQLAAATWIKISTILRGEQFLIGSTAETGVKASTSYHLTSGNQNFYTIPVQLSVDQVNQRVQLIDQLLVGNSNAAAIDALQKARAALLTRL